MIKIGFKGGRIANRKVGNMVNTLRRSGRLVSHTRKIVNRLKNYMQSIVHIDTGTLHDAIRTRIDNRGLGEVFIDPSATNPTGQRAAMYGPIENARGGAHAFFDRTANEGSEDALAAGIASLREALFK